MYMYHYVVVKKTYLINKKLAVCRSLVHNLSSSILDLASNLLFFTTFASEDNLLIDMHFFAQCSAGLSSIHDQYINIFFLEIIQKIFQYRMKFSSTLSFDLDNPKLIFWT